MLYIDGIYKNKNTYKTWKGFRLCVIDGTSIRLPDEPNIIEHFGVQKGKLHQADCFIGMASVFYMVSPTGFEPVTYALGGHRAIQLCHGDLQGCMLITLRYK